MESDAGSPDAGSTFLAQGIAQRIMLETLMFAVFRGRIEEFNPYSTHVLGLADAIGDELVDTPNKKAVARATLESVEGTVRLVRKWLEEDERG